MKNFRLALAADTKTVGGPIREEGALAKMRADTAARLAERNAILQKFRIASQPIGEESSYGQVYLGYIDGAPIALKIEQKGSDSNELQVLRKLQKLRDKAPDNVRVHLPVVYSANEGKHWNYYAMEVLEKLPESLKDDIFGEHWNWLGKPGADSSLNRNVEVAPIWSDKIELSLDKDKWLDTDLVGKAFDAWYARTEAASKFYEEAGVDSTDEESFQKAARQSFVSAAGELAARWGKMTAAEATSKIDSMMAGKLEDPEWRSVWADMSRSLPELLFVIARTSRMSRWHKSDKNQVGEYETLRQVDSPENSDYRAGLQETLRWLAERGIVWGDVHSGNAMLRPGTGDIVFIDFGLYRVTHAYMKISLMKI